MAPQRVSPLCSKPLDSQLMTFEGSLVGLRITLAAQHVNVALIRLFILQESCSKLFELVQACFMLCQVVRKPLFTDYLVCFSFPLFK